MAAPALVQERHIPVASPVNALALAVKPCGLERQELVANRGIVGLEVADDRKLGAIVPGSSLKIGIHRSRSRSAGVGERLDVPLEPPSAGGGVGRNRDGVSLRRRAGTRTSDHRRANGGLEQSPRISDRSGGERRVEAG